MRRELYYRNFFIYSFKLLFKLIYYLYGSLIFLNFNNFRSEAWSVYLVVFVGFLTLITRKD
jgi:hypothetical protein